MINTKQMKYEEMPPYGANIIRGADENNYNLVDAAIRENPKAIIFQDAATGLSALHVAAGDGNFSMFQYLLSIEGADPTLRDKFNRDPLEMAIAIGHKGIIESLSKRLYPKSFTAGENPQGETVVPLTPR